MRAPTKEAAGVGELLYPRPSKALTRVASLTAINVLGKSAEMAFALDSYACVHRNC